MVQEIMRLDKLLCMLGLGTRSEVQKGVRAGRVTLDGVPVRDPGLRIDAQAQQVMMDGHRLFYKRVRHVMMNKPKGVLTAARDSHAQTVMDLLPPLYAAMGCMPAGRLDKDTEGLLVITSDGQLAHRIISPKKDVGKLYEAEVDGALRAQDVQAFACGLHIADSDGIFEAKPAQLTILESSPTHSRARVCVSEGKYHQVKRMFAARGVHVTALRRLRIGALTLDPALNPGMWREMTEDEVALLERADNEPMPTAAAPHKEDQHA